MFYRYSNGYISSVYPCYGNPIWTTPEEQHRNPQRMASTIGECPHANRFQAKSSTNGLRHSSSLHRQAVFERPNLRGPKKEEPHEGRPLLGGGPTLPQQHPEAECTSTATLSGVIQPAARKRVRWANSVMDSLSPGQQSQRRDILLSSEVPAVMTSPFCITLIICGHDYSVPFFAVPAKIACLESFEHRLLTAAKDDHKSTLRAFLNGGYTLRIQRLHKASVTIIPAVDNELRQAAFNRFLNSVFRDANVGLY
jgi:hypothetical protein